MDADYSPKTDVVRSPAPPGAKGAALMIHTLTLKGRKDLVSALLKWVLDLSKVGSKGGCMWVYAQTTTKIALTVSVTKHSPLDD